MPSGRTHDRITFWCLPAVVIPTALITRSPVITSIVSASFLVGGLMLGPDLDIHSVQYTRWGPLRWIWLPYQIAIKHRSPISHGPIIGTALRVIYLSFWLALFALLTVETLNFFWDAKLSWEVLQDPFRNLAQKYLIEWVAIVIGLELGSVSHSVSDSIGSYLTGKKRRGKKRRKRPRS
ncbi:MAG: metal-binding protein [Cyanobacteria bacterium P01_D01_bin.36]